MWGNCYVKWFIVEKKTSFHGRNYYKIDVKGRVPFPAQWFEPLNLRFGESLIVARGLSHSAKYLELYSPSGWAEKMADIEGAFPEGELKSKIVRWYVSTAESVDLDTQNRIRLPKHLSAYGEILKDVVLLGCVDRIEIWAKELLDEVDTPSKDEFDQIFDLLNGYKEKKNDF